MSRKTLIITATILIIFFLALIAYYFIVNGNSGDSSGNLSFRSFLPFGGGGNNSSDDESNNSNSGQNNGGGDTDNTDNQNQNYNNQTNYTKKLRRLSDEPVSGAGTFDTKAGTVVRYIEKATGHIYEVELFSPKKNRISNTTIPQAYEAIWGNKAGSVFASYLNNDNIKISSYLLNLKNSTTSGSAVSAIQLSEDVYSGSVFGNSVFYLQKEFGVGSNGYVSSFDGTKRKQVWASDFTDFGSQYVNDKTVALNTKPAQGIDGFLYKIDLTTGKTRKLLGGIPGLTSLVSYDESKILYLRQDGNNTLNIYDAKNKITDALGFVTFPEKCVWSKKNIGSLYCATPRIGVPNDGAISWYKGLYQSSDAINFYDSRTKYLNQIIDLNLEGQTDIDVTDPILSENENFLIFINKRDGSLWSLDISRNSIGTSTQTTN